MVGIRAGTLAPQPTIFSCSRSYMFKYITGTRVRLDPWNLTKEKEREEE